MKHNTKIIAFIMCKPNARREEEMLSQEEVHNIASNLLSHRVLTLKVWNLLLILYIIKKGSFFRALIFKLG